MPAFTRIGNHDIAAVIHEGIEWRKDKMELAACCNYARTIVPWFVSAHACASKIVRMIRILAETGVLCYEFTSHEIVCVSLTCVETG